MQRSKTILKLGEAQHLRQPLYVLITSALFPRIRPERDASSSNDKAGDIDAQVCRSEDGGEEGDRFCREASLEHSGRRFVEEALKVFVFHIRLAPKSAPKDQLEDGDAKRPDVALCSYGDLVDASVLQVSARRAFRREVGVLTHRHALPLPAGVTPAAQHPMTVDFKHVAQADVAVSKASLMSDRERLAKRKEDPFDLVLAVELQKLRRILFEDRIEEERGRGRCCWKMSERREDAGLGFGGERGEVRRGGVFRERELLLLGQLTEEEAVMLSAVA